jgi:FkbM family methyltransferase
MGILRNIKEVFRPIIKFYYKSRARLTLHKFYQQFVDPKELVFDIGAHMGETTRALLKIGAKVIAAEPNPVAANTLKHKYGENKNLTVVQKGIGGSEGRKEFFIDETNTQLSTFSKDWNNLRSANHEINILNIETVSLDYLIKSYGVPKFCKIDVEGFEVQVLSGLSHKIQYISFEFSKDFISEINHCIGKVLTLGDAEFNFTLYSRYKLELKEWVSGNRLIMILHSYPNYDLTGDIIARYI